MLREAEVIDFNVHDFNHKVRLQKYVYLARDFGPELGHDLNMYIHRPYSRELAGDYYGILEDVRPEGIKLD